MVSRVRRAVLAIVAAGAAGPCACTLLVGVPDHLTGGASSDGSTSDAASDGSSDVRSPADAAKESGRGNDASDTDAAGGPDASTDDVDAGAYPPDSWCGMQPPTGLVLCDDFDRDTLSFSRWTTQDFGVLGSSGFSSTSVSPPSSLQIDVPPHTSSTYFLEILEKDVTGAPSARAVTLDYQFQPLAWPDGGSGQIYTAALAQGPGSPRVALSLFTGSTGTELQEQITDSAGNDTFNTGMSGFVPPVGFFSHLTLTVSFGDSPTAVLADSGAPLITLQLQGNWQPGTNTAVFLGDWYVTTTPGFQILYDNATIRQQ